MVYERFVKQLDGCTYCSGGLNCTCACEAMWLYRASQGRVLTTACAVRVKTGDRVGGTHLGQMELVSRSYGITTGRVYRPIAWQTFVDLIKTGRYGAHLNMLYAPFRGTQYDCFFGNFRGNHDLFISGMAGTLSMRVGDPGADGRLRSGRRAPLGFQSIPISLLKRAAGLLDIGGRPLGDGKAYVYLTPADPIVATLPHQKSITVRPTSLWNDTTKRWVYNGDSRLPTGTRLELRGKGFSKGGVNCYPVTDGHYAAANGTSKYAGYYVPVANVKLLGPTS